MYTVLFAALLVAQTPVPETTAKPVITKPQRTKAEQDRINATAKAERDKAAQKAKDLKMAEQLEREANALDFEVAKETSYPSLFSPGESMSPSEFSARTRTAILRPELAQVSKRGRELQIEAKAKRAKAEEIKSRYPKPKRRH